MSNFPPYAVAVVDDRVRLLKWNERDEAYKTIASAPPSSRLELSSIAEDLNDAETRRALDGPAETPEPREIQLDAMVIHHEAGAERAPELHADRRGSFGETPEERAAGQGRAVAAQLARSIGFRGISEPRA